MIDSNYQKNYLFNAYNQALTKITVDKENLNIFVLLLNLGPLQYHNYMNEKGKQIEVAVSPEQKIAVDKDDSLQSTYLDEYSSKMSQFNNSLSNILEDFKRKIQPQMCLTLQQQFNSQFDLKIIEESINKEIIFLNVKWGNFSLNIKILNIQGENTKHIREHNCGMFGRIYKGKFNQEEFIIKCLPLQYKDSRFRAIKELFIMKIASIAGVGPKLEPYFGFDILMFSECIQFAMEQCKQISVHNSKTHQFYENLATLHKLHIVHQDIKPENIMYSPGYDRPVFIDFGLSRLVEENIGFKTITNYVGTIDYWSPEMGKCFREKKQMLIDLYYNDLYGLEKTIEFYKSQLFDDTESASFFLEQIEQQNYFSYLILPLVKFYIYHNHLGCFMKFYHQQILKIVKMESALVNFYESEILHFFEEITPIKQIKDFFRFFVKDKYKDTLIYSKLNTLYQVSRKNICSIEVFRNGQKYNYFSNICAQMMVQGKQASNRDRQNQNIAKLMVNKQMIQQLPFHRYLSIYLAYVSYTLDKYNVSNEKRVEAAHIYYQIFIRKVKPLKSLQLIGQTILHALGQCLKLQQKLQQIATLLFKLYDFLLILDLGTTDQFIKWLDKIYHHRSLCSFRKKIFVYRVQQSNHINTIRCNSVKHVSWIDFFEKISDWVISKKRQYQYCNLEYKQQEINVLPVQFQTQFVLQTVALSIIMERKKYDNCEADIMMMDLYYKTLQVNQKKQKINYSLIFLYYDSSILRDNNNLCKQIENLFISCIRDKQILSQFNFQLISLVYNTFVYRVSTLNISINQLNAINKQVFSVQKSDLLIFEQIFDKIWNQIHQLKYLLKINVDKYFQKDGFITKIKEILQENFFNRFSTSQLQHLCEHINELYWILHLGKTLQASIGSNIKWMFRNQQNQLKINCQKCFKSIKLLGLIYQIQKYFELINDEIRQQSKYKLSKEQVIGFFFKKYCQLWKKIYKIQDFDGVQQNIVLWGLLKGALLCCMYPDFEQKYSCIYNLYVFCEKQKLLHIFLTWIEENNLFPRLIKILKSKDISQLASFLTKIILIIGKSVRVKWYKLVRGQTYPILATMNNKQLCQLFTILRTLHEQNKNNFPQSHYIILLYSCIASLTRQISLFKQSLKAIVKDIEHLDFSFRRRVILSIYDKLVNSESLVMKISIRRKWLFYNNKFIKLLMVDGQTIPRKQPKPKKSVHHWHFALKMNKIQIFQNPCGTVKYRKK